MRHRCLCAGRLYPLDFEGSIKYQFQTILTPLVFQLLSETMRKFFSWGGNG